MLSRTELQERLQALSGDLCQRDDLVWACVRREREALETALWLAERAEWLARSDGDCPDCPSYGDDCRDDEGLIPCVGPSCELRTWLQREATDD